MPGSLLAVISSPYARKGVLFATWQKYHDQPDSDVVLVQAPTLDLNPTFDRRAIERSYEDDPSSAAAEFGAQSRSDVESFVSQDAIDACVIPGRIELPRVAGVRYAAFLDFAGGGIGGDSVTLAIAHPERHDDRTIGLLDLVREVQPPRCLGRFWVLQVEPGPSIERTATSKPACAAHAKRSATWRGSGPDSRRGITGICPRTEWRQ